MGRLFFVTFVFKTVTQVLVRSLQKNANFLKADLLRSCCLFLSGTDFKMFFLISSVFFSFYATIAAIAFFLQLIFAFNLNAMTQVTPSTKPSFIICTTAISKLTELFCHKNL